MGGRPPAHMLGDLVLSDVSLCGGRKFKKNFFGKASKSRRIAAMTLKIRPIFVEIPRLNYA